MKQKAFLFDMDGVMVNSEKVWSIHSNDFDENLFGKDVLEKIGDSTGMRLMQMYEVARTHGFAMGREEFIETYDTHAQRMYALASITEGLEELVCFLKEQSFKIGIVSSSRRVWIEWVLEKIAYKNNFDLVLSLDEWDLPTKPSPAGYREAMKQLGASPATTIILEDSNAGIIAAKKSGAYTIAFTPLLVVGYAQTVPSNAKADSMEEVIEIVKKKLQ